MFWFRKRVRPPVDWRCETCVFAVPDLAFPGTLKCNRMPMPVNIDKDHFCGEYIEKEKK